MYLVSVSGSADELSALRSSIRMVAPKATEEPEGQWRVDAYVDAESLATLRQTDLPVVVLQDEAAVDSHFATTRAQIEED